MIENSLVIKSLTILCIVCLVIIVVLIAYVVSINSAIKANIAELNTIQLQIGFLEKYISDVQESIEDVLIGTQEELGCTLKECISKEMHKEISKLAFTPIKLERRL